VRPAGIDPEIAFAEYAKRQTGETLRRFEFEVNRAARLGSAEAIHDLRVSIRRLSHCLRLFRQFFPRAERKRIRRSLKGIMTLAARVRDRDVALELLAKAGLATDSPLALELRQARESGNQALLADLKRWGRHSASRRWRAALGV